MRFALSPTQSDFVHCDHEVVFLKGPKGEGKTYAGIVAAIQHSDRCGCDIRAALIRDTHKNIEMSTANDIREILGPRVSFHKDNTEAVFLFKNKVNMALLGIDDPAAFSKLQAFQCCLIWLEEPAPIVDRANAGVAEKVFELAIAAASRQKGTRMRVQVTMNPSDTRHWTAKVSGGPEILAEFGGVKIRKSVFHIPKGENQHLNTHTRAANMAAFAHDPTMRLRYIEGVDAPDIRGKAVATGYNPKIHLSEKELDVVEGGLGIRMWDGWHHPCCVIGQWLPPGRLWIHQVIYMEMVGIKELIELPNGVISAVKSPKFRDRIKDWRDIGDPSMRTPDQSTRDESAARIIEKLLNTRFEPGPVALEYRLRPMNSALLNALGVDRNPKIQISKSAEFLHVALSGGWHFKTDNSGNIIGNQPEKDEYSHVGDAFSYGCATLFPFREMKKKDKPPIQERIKKAMSYGNYGMKR